MKWHGIAHPIHDKRVQTTLVTPSPQGYEGKIKNSTSAQQETLGPEELLFGSFYPWGFMEKSWLIPKLSSTLLSSHFQIIFFKSPLDDIQGPRHSPSAKQA